MVKQNSVGDQVIREKKGMDWARYKVSYYGKHL
jgi:hypothetical protein